MSRLKLLIIAGSMLVMLSALVVGVMVPFANAAAGPNPDRDAPLYSAPGPYRVGTRDLVIDSEAPLDVTIWYPALSGGDRRAKTRYAYEIKMGAPLGTVTFATYSGRAVRDAPYDLAAGPQLLVVLSPGFSIGPSTHGWLAEHLASYGFVVMAPDHPDRFDAELSGLWQSAVTRPQDVLTLFAYVDDQVGSGGAFEGVIDPESVAVVGHSYGGYTALAAAGAQMDTGRFEALCQAAYKADDPGAWLYDKVLPHVADMADLAGLDSVPEGLWQQACRIPVWTPSCRWPVMRCFSVKMAWPGSRCR